MDDLYSELTSYTQYLTGWGGSEVEPTLRFALEVAYIAHRGQKRRSGEDFIIHPVQVASILAQSRMDLPSLVSGLLHDTVEDTDLSFEEIEAAFGPEVRQIVEGETKVSKLPKVVRATLDDSPSSKAASKRDEQAENLRSMFVAMADDWRIVIVKLADRLHNMRTLEHMPAAKRVSIARETLEIFTPLAHRLGMWSFKTELGDLSFSHLFPEDHRALKAYIENKSDSYRAALAVAERKLKQQVHNDPWLRERVRRVAVEGRTKSIHSTWRKMQRRDCRVEEVHDLLAMRIILEMHEGYAEEYKRQYDRRGGGGGGGGQFERVGGNGNQASEAAAQWQGMHAEHEFSLCYHVLGKVHGLWTPLPRTLKDYISSPKPNGYRSLHTTVLIGTGVHENGAQPLEVQIRTSAMHNIAEHGAAAHWAYKEDASLPWRQAIMRWRSEHQCAHEFMQLVRQELLCTRVFVFTEGGRILNLALGATLADAAEILDVPLNSESTTPYLCSHNMCEAASLQTELRNGDIVCFAETAEDAHSAVAPAEAKDGGVLEQSTGGGAGAAGGPAFGSDGRPKRRVGGMPSPSELTHASMVDGCLLTDTQWAICSQCLPLPGDELLCTLQTKPQGMARGAVHRVEPGRAARCKMLRRQLADGMQLIERGEELCELAEATSATGERGEEGAPPRLTTSLVVFVRDEPGTLLSLTEAVTRSSLSILDVSSETRDVTSDAGAAAAAASGGPVGAFQFRVQIRSLEQLHELSATLAALPQVKHVRRDSIQTMLEAAETSRDGFWRLAEEVGLTEFGHG